MKNIASINFKGGVGEITVRKILVYRNKTLDFDILMTYILDIPN